MYQIRTSRILIHLLGAIIAALFLFGILIIAPPNSENWGFYIIIFSLGGFFIVPPAILHINYINKNKNQIITIDAEEGALTFDNTKSGITTKLLIQKIQDCIVFDSNFFNLPFTWWSYTYLLIRTDTEQVIITSYVIDPVEFLIESNLEIEPTFSHKFIPTTY